MDQHCHFGDRGIHPVEQAQLEWDGDLLEPCRPVRPLPEFVVRELDSVPKRSERHWFWTGNCKRKTAVSDWQGRLKTLLDDAKITDGHAHRFRDTFAVELLLAGVPLERVSILLGHASIKITEKHYSPWIRERQEQAEADVRRTWTKDSIVLLETKGTPEVHGTAEVVN